jgi:hypothetical protein
MLIKRVEECAVPLMNLHLFQARLSNMKRAIWANYGELSG